MAKVDSRRFPQFLRELAPACRVVLLHGDDPGLVRERGNALLQAVTEGEGLRLVDLPREAAKDTGLLAAEAASLPLIGGRVAVRVRETTDAFAEAAKQALGGPGPGLVVLEAPGEARTTQKLRRLLEPAPAAAVIPCYRETGTELAGSIGRILGEMEVQAEPAALAWLAQRLGDDRMLLRRELEKLAQYLGPGGRATQEDVLACIAEGSVLDLEEALMAALAGDLAVADRALDAAFAEGAAAVQVVRTALRHVQRLHLAALAVAGGAAPAAALDGLRPPVFWKHKPLLERALRAWRAEALEAAGAALLEAERRTKTTGLPDLVIARAAVMALARQASRPAR
jgi:DNA polymerase-3 subunit delta